MSGINIYYAFQFHIVRLKEVCRRGIREPLLQFQFHIVRLKDISAYISVLVYSVSIPYSSIKSLADVKTTYKYDCFNSI